MSKRIADHYLTDQNCEEKEETIEAGSWKNQIASKEVLAGRKVVKARRRTGGRLVPDNINDSIIPPPPMINNNKASPFENIALFGKKIDSEEIKSPIHPFVEPKSAINKLAEEKPHLQRTDIETKEFKAKSETFMKELSSMNKIFAKHLSSQLEDSHSVVLTPIFDDYNLYLAKLQSDAGLDRNGDVSLEYVLSLQSYSGNTTKSQQYITDLKNFRKKQLKAGFDRDMIAVPAYMTQFDEFKADPSKCKEYADAIRKHDKNTMRTPAFGNKDNVIGANTPFSGFKKPDFSKSFEVSGSPKPIFNSEPAKPIFNSEPAKPIFNSEPAKPIFNSEPAKPIFNSESAKPIFNSESPESIFNKNPIKPLQTSDIPKPIFSALPMKPESKPEDSLKSQVECGFGKPAFGGKTLFKTDGKINTVFGGSTSSNFTFGAPNNVKNDAGDVNKVEPFGMAAKSIGTSGFSFDFAKNKTFPSFGKQTMATVKPVENEDKYTPPVDEVKEIIEDDAFYTVKCKLFYKKGDKYNDRGVGNLHLKKLADNKTSLLIRAATNLGNILLNIKVNKDMPVSRSGKNNVSIYCVANPPIDKESTDPVSFLIRVKNGDLADVLKEKIEESKPSA